eukprot:1940216-Alexandrium_andersonii.AAC.1
MRLTVFQTTELGALRSWFAVDGLGRCPHSDIEMESGQSPSVCLSLGPSLRRTFSVAGVQTRPAGT